MQNLIFDENTLYDSNIFKFENRLKSQVSKYTEGGTILSTYFSQDRASTTVDRGLGAIDKLFGKGSPMRFNKIENFPLNDFGPANPENDDSQQIEDINITGDCTILPGTIVPYPNDFFIINHLKMKAIFQVTNVVADAMKIEGYYKISYRLISNSEETIAQVLNQVNDTYHTDLNALGTNLNPIIKKDDFIYRGKIKAMISSMINSYKALYYNSRHNCFLFVDNQESGMEIFDPCANRFIANHSLMNTPNATQVIVLNDKLNDSLFELRYMNSIFHWLELGAPAHLLRKFTYTLDYADQFIYSSFSLWGEGWIQCIQPLSTNEPCHKQIYSYFNDTQFNAFLDDKYEPENEYEKLIWKFIHKESISIHDVSLYTADALLSAVNTKEIFMYTPIIIYIIRQILEMG